MSSVALAVFVVLASQSLAVSRSHQLSSVVVIGTPLSWNPAGLSNSPLLVFAVPSCIGSLDPQPAFAVFVVTIAAARPLDPQLVVAVASILSAAALGRTPS